MIKVLLADDEALLRAGIRILLDTAPDIEVVGEATTGLEAVNQARATQADVVLMDIRMPDMDGIEATRAICGDESLARGRVIILTTFELHDHVLAAIRAGASGFLGKSANPEQLLEAVRVVAGGESLLSARATAHLLESVRQIPTHSALPRIDLAGLTAREREIVELVARGLSNEEIGALLFLSPLTVKTHVSRASIKLDARDRAQLVAIFFQGNDNP
ncbi:response regulator transcription factor [Nonomuraea jiangxiensis]|uniref:DNA-binding response regulator, NarL/FixJ family, contains REC and HTH domains n=1 Tax=Nonomuraea jiangxiensis TaxID=633440 RepID=A0A1G9UGP7_9ACTN|nr:response regulator transcription factor [Nonomuraea jiangxiensis]SDM59130.1 DNA-binding response regulator, NarL/FixJ family, contains REC and HTH domains [Nonomuraea jiangxiensis]